MSRIRTQCIAPVTLAALAALAAGCNSNGTAGDDLNAAASRAVNQAALVRPVAAPVSTSVRPNTVRLTSAIHPFARPQNDTGRVDPEQVIENLSLFFKLTPEQRKDRDTLVAAQLDAKSPEYRHWLTPATYATRFGARPEDMTRAAAWLTSQGFTVHRTSPLGTRVTFSGKVGALEAAFQTEMHHYLVGGETHYAMATAPAFPMDLADIVLGLHNTHDFYKRPVSERRIEAAIARRSDPRFTLTFDAGPDAGDAGSFQVLGPPDWAAAYDVAKLYTPGIGGKQLDGTGVTVAVVGTAEIAQSDIDAFRTQFGLPQSTVTMTLVPNTGPAAAGRRGNGVEAILDVEWSGGIAKGAQINYVFVGSTDRNVDDASFYLIEENLAPVMSESFGGCEQGSLPTDADILEENGTAANLLGITYMAAAGDDGAADCGGGEFGGPGLYVDMPGSFPGVTSVGGTQFPSPGWNAAGDLVSYPTVEQVWNESDDPYSKFGVGAGGGGISSVFARPAYQSGVAACVPVGSLPTPEPNPMRQVPDIALSAASATPGYFIECTFGAMGDCAATGGAPEALPIGGTSCSSPSFAGVVGILNQAAGERLGNINPLLYEAATTTASALPFHDITLGNNEIACGDGGAGDAGGPGAAGWPDGVGCGAAGLYGYPATTGYDCASGLGSIDGFNLISALVKLNKTTTTLAVAPTETTEGTPVNLTATVETLGVNAADLSGNVTFTFESYTTTGETDLSWELGSVALSGGSATKAQASLSTAIPVGLVKPTDQWVDVVAVYGGDTAHLSSTSAKVGVGFAKVSFAIDPPTLTLPANGTHTFTVTGGVLPVRWFLNIDTTSGRPDGGMFGAAEIDENAGTLEVGPKAGYVEIAAIDKDGAEAVANITVGAPTVPPPWAADSGVYIDSGVPPVFDAGVPKEAGKPDAGQVVQKEAGTTVHKDAGQVVKDAGHDAATEEPSSGGGCSCEVVKGDGEGRGLLGGLGSVLLGLAAFVRRRRVAR